VGWGSEAVRSECAMIVYEISCDWDRLNVSVCFVLTACTHVSAVSCVSVPRPVCLGVSDPDVLRRALSAEFCDWNLFVGIAC